MALKIVTDSSCDLPPDLALSKGITVVPCYVYFGDQEFKDGLDLGPDEFYERLVASSDLPTTSQPSVADFIDVYRALSDEGHDVVSIHLSAKLSGTLNSALQAREALMSDTSSQAASGGRIEIIDSNLASMALGLVVLEAAEMVESGATCDQVVEGVNANLPLTHCQFTLDTLEYLQKGGRIGKASAFLGSLLSIKPILRVHDGEVHPVERVRTRQKALNKLEEIVRGLEPVRRLGVIYNTSPGEAEALRDRLSDLVPKEEIIMSRFGPAVGRYVGPNALGVGLISGS